MKQDYIPTQCGVCGDGYMDSVPRANENGGLYGNGVIAGDDKLCILILILCSFELY